MLLYIAEKPSTMILVKKAYERSNKPCGDITFVALAGHVCGLMEPKEYSQWNLKWKDLKLPMVPDSFRIKSIKPDLVKKIRDLIKSGDYKGIIVGTDSDVEGNGIYALLEKNLHLEKMKAYRFFETDLTDKGIMDSFKNLTDFHTCPRDVGMTQAFWIRAQFDWLIGFNLSVAYTVKTGMLMRVGRVKAPTLKLVYDNCKAIDEFSSKSSYLPVIQTKDPEMVATLVDEEGKDLAFPELEKAKELVSGLGPEAIVKKTEKKKPKSLRSSCTNSQTYRWRQDRSTDTPRMRPCRLCSHYTRRTRSCPIRVPTENIFLPRKQKNFLPCCGRYPLFRGWNHICLPSPLKPSKKQRQTNDT